MHFSTASFMVAAGAVASALTIVTPDATGWRNGTVTTTWTSTQGDPSVFNIYLRDTQTPSVINPLAVVSGVQTAAGKHTFVLPPVPFVNTYQLDFVNVTNMGQTYTSSATFPVNDQPRASTTPANTATGTTTGTNSRSTGTGTTAAASATTPARTNGAAGMHVPVALVFLGGLAASLL